MFDGDGEGLLDDPVRRQVRLARQPHCRVDAQRYIHPGVGEPVHQVWELRKPGGPMKTVRPWARVGDVGTRLGAKRSEYLVQVR